MTRFEMMRGIARPDAVSHYRGYRYNKEQFPATLRAVGNCSPDGLPTSQESQHPKENSCN
jgi:hypothetical protein